jgi:hypothetical protein
MANINFPSSPVVGDTYTLNNKTWTWNGSSWAGSSGSTSTIYSQINYFTDTFTGNGSNTVFSLSTSSTTNNSLVFVSGLGQLPTSAYSISGTTITFTEAIANGAAIEVRTPSAFNIYSNPTSTTLTNYYYTATAGANTFSGSDNNTNILSYVPGAITVYINGVKQVPSIDFTASDGSSVVFTSNLYEGDVVEVVSQSAVSFVQPSISIQSVPSVTIGSIAFETVGQITTSSISAISIDVLNINSYRSAKYMVQITDTTNNLYHFCELLVLHNGTSAFITEYGSLYSSYSLMSFDASIAGSSLFVTGTPTNSNNTVKIYRVAVGV